MFDLRKNIKKGKNYIKKMLYIFKLFNFYINKF